MANISFPSGKFNLVGNWTQSMLADLNIIKDEWKEWWYNTVIEGDFTKDRKSLPFCGQGKWAYCYNLDRIGIDTETSKKEDIVTAYKTLCSNMENEDSYIEVEYVDEEGGCQCLYKATAKLYGENGKLHCVETNCEEYEYTKENREKLGYSVDDEE